MTAAPTTSRPTGVAEPERVVLLDAQRRPSGTALKSEVHSAETPLHLAFSCYVFDADGRVLLTRRALEKRTWPGVWTNTCCGHPAPGEDPYEAVERRLADELGLVVGPLSLALPDFAYRAVDAGGVVENEFCPVWTVTLPHPTPAPLPNDSEVMDWRWVAWDDLARAVAATPFAFSPWSVRQVPLLHDQLAGARA